MLAQCETVSYSVFLIKLCKNILYTQARRHLLASIMSTKDSKNLENVLSATEGYFIKIIIVAGRFVVVSRENSVRFFVRI